MDFAAIMAALAPPGPNEPARAVQEAPRFSRGPVDWERFYGFEEMPGWNYDRGIAGFGHVGLAPHYNELTPYVKATRDMDNGLLAGIGRTYNSEGADSVFAGVGDSYGPVWWELGGATGYEAAPVVPFGRVGVDLNDLISLWAMPAYDGNSVGGVFGANFNALRF